MEKSGASPVDKYYSKSTYDSNEHTQSDENEYLEIVSNDSVSAGSDSEEEQTPEIDLGLDGVKLN